MKILFVNNFFSTYGGAEKVMINQAALLAKNGHKVAFFATDRQPLAQNNYDYSCFFSKFTDYKSLNNIDSIKILPKIFYNSESEKNLLKLLKIFRPDIIHCHNIYYHLTPSVVAACKKARIPVVMTMHDPRLICPGGTMMHRGESYCYKEYCVKGNPLYCMLYRCRNSSLTESIISTLEYSFSRLRGLYDYVSLFICPSRAVHDLAIKANFSSKRLTVLNNFIEDYFFESPPVYANKGYFLYIGRLAKEKGVNYLIEAAKFLPKNIKFHIAGNGPEKENLINQTKSLGLPNIRFKGYLEGEALKKEYSGCIATILPSNWFEVFGLTIAESFAYGKPVIASRIGAIPELITENTDGLMFTPGNVEELSHAIYNLYKDRGTSSLMGKNARKKAERMFHSELHYKNLIEIYNTALN